MSGLEVVAVIAGIISAYTGAHIVFQNWRQARESRRRNKQNLKLNKSLVVGSSTIQHTYDEHFARLGQRFAVGDSELTRHCGFFS
jgi:hypothetical protein